MHAEGRGFDSCHLHLTKEGKMVTAKEARESALMARQGEALKKREEERNRQAEITATADDLVDDLITKLDKDIKKSIRRGEMFETYVADDNEIEQALISKLAAHYTEDGYKIRRESYTVDHGDSAAPCVCAMLRLTVSW